MGEAELRKRENANGFCYGDDRPYGALRRARGIERALLGGKHDDIFRTARAPYSRETAIRHAAPRKTLDGFGNDDPKRTEGPLEAQFVFERKNVEELEQDRVER